MRKLYEWGKKSATMVVVYITALVGSVWTGILQLADVFNAPDVKANIQQFGGRYVGLILIAIAVLGGIARLRTLRRQ